MAQGHSPPNLLTPAPKEIRLLMSVSFLQQHWDSSYIYVEHPAVSLSHLHQACPSEPPTLDICMLTSHTGVTCPPLISSTSGFLSVRDSFLPALPSPSDHLALPASSYCAPSGLWGHPGRDLRGGRAGQPESHGEAGERNRSPAGGFELGAAQVEFAPGQRRHRVLVEKLITSE